MKKLITLLFALIAIASTLVAQDQVPNYLCFKRVRATESKLVFSWGNCGTDELKTNISYSIDAKHWNKFTVSSWQCHSPTHSVDGPRWYTVSVTTDCNVARELYLKSSNIVKSEEIFSFGYSHLTIIPYIYSVEKLGDIYVSGNFNALLQDPYDFENNYENWTSRTVNSTAWDIVFCAGEKHQHQYTESNRNKGLRNQVVGVDMSFFDPISEMYQGWTKLSWIKVKFDSWGKNGYNNWVKGVATEGVFICPRGLEIKYGNNYIPENWQVVYLDELRTVNIPDSLKDYISIFKTEDIIPNSSVKFSVKERTGYNVTAVTVCGSDNRQIPLTRDYGYIFTMPEDDVTINVVYTPIEYSVTTSADCCSANKTVAFVNDEIELTFFDKIGYDFISAYYYCNDKSYSLKVIDKKAKFTMPAGNVKVIANYKAIQYNVATDEYVTADKSTANITNRVTFTVKDRTSEGYKLNRVLINGKVVSVSNYTGSFEMKDYLKEVTIKATYSKSCYSITTDSYSTTDKTVAYFGDRINVTFTKIAGYTLASATYNGTALSINDYKSSFTMPAADVEIKSVYSPIPYVVSCADANITTDKTTATIENKVNIIIKDRTPEGYKLDKVLVNSTEIAVQDFKASFDMKDYLKDVTITAQYSKIPYTITTDEYSQVANTTANMGDVVNVTFKQREGYTLTSATYNGAALTVNNYKSSFTMPAANVEIKTVYAPIAYTVSCADANITADNTTATIEDKVNLTIKDRTSEGYKLDKVLVNSAEIAVKDFKASFDMKDYLKDVTISAQYSQIAYTITTDEYSQVVNTTAAVDDAITVTFKQREGFDLVSATYNGNPLNINNYKASFTMPAQNVEIKTVYAEKEYEIAKPSEDVQISQPTAKAGDEINITVTIKDGYTAHLYVNGQEVALNGNLANYIMPSGKIEIKVEYVANPKTPVSEIYLDNCAVSVFPNPAKSGEEITFKVGGKFDMNNAKIYLYNASGSLVMQIDNVKEYNQLTLRSGVYVGVLVTKGGKKTFRVAVK